MNNQWREALDYARWAPSPHNAQQWKLKIINENEADLFVDVSRWPVDEDTTFIFCMLGISIFTETLDIYFSNFNKSLEVNWTYNKLFGREGLIKVANLKVVDMVRVPVFDKELILKRQSSRLPYNGEKVDKETLSQIKIIAEKFSNEAFFSEDEKVIKDILWLNEEALFDDLKRPVVNKEIILWSRFSKWSAKYKKDGLSAECMNLNPVVFYLFLKCRWFFEIPFVKKYVDSYYQSTYVGTPLLMWYEGKFSTYQDAIQNGKMFCQIWLLLAKNGYYTHPFGSVITHAEPHEKMLKIFNYKEKKDEMIWFLFRVGKSKKPPQSYRLNVDNIII